MRRSLFFTIFLVMVLGTICFGKGELISAVGVPVFPGSVPDREAEDEAWRMNYLDVQEEYRPSQYSVEVYSASAAPEEVCLYYIEQLQAEEGSPEWGYGKSDEGSPGQAACYELEYYGSDEFRVEYYGDEVLYDGEWLRSILARRACWEGGRWIRAARFYWQTVSPDGEVLECSVVMEDDGVNMQDRRFEDKTRIVAEVYTVKDEEQMDAEWDEFWDGELADERSYLEGIESIEAELGLPIYPGAEFDPDMSAGMSMAGQRIYIFLTDDIVDDVRDFYENEFGLGAEVFGSGYAIVLQGELPFPEEMIAIEPNILFEGTAKTVISIVRAE